MPAIILSDNGATSGSAGLKTSGGNDGVLQLQTTTSGGTPTTAISISNTQVVTYTNQPTYTGGTANGVLYLNGSKAVTSGTALVFDGTNLGIGVTPSAWSSAGGRRAIQLGYAGGGAIFTSGAAATLSSFVHGAYNDGTNWLYGATSVSAGRYEITGGNTGSTHAWYNSAGGTAGNTITFTQAMTLDASGNLLVGTTTSAYKTTAYVSGQDGFCVQNSATGTGTGNGTLFGLDSSSNGVMWSFDAVNLVFGNTNTERARIDTSGNFLVGSTGAGFAASGRGLIEVNGTSTGMYGLKANGAAMGYFACSTSVVEISTNGAYPLLFTINGAERARFTSGGEFAIGKTQASETASTGSGFGFAAPAVDPFFSVVNNSASGGNANVYLNKRTSGAILVIQTNNGSTNTTVGSISHNGTNTAYNTSSDYRLKHDIQPMTGALGRVAALKPCTYKWNANGAVGEGFIAHELQAVVPAAVNGEKDAVNKDGSINPQGIDTSYLVATLTAAIQEQQAIIETLTNRITALEQT